MRKSTGVAGRGGNVAVGRLERSSGGVMPHTARVCECDAAWAVRARDGALHHAADILGEALAGFGAEGVEELA